MDRRAAAVLVVFLAGCGGAAGDAESSTVTGEEDFSLSNITPAMSLLPSIENSGGGLDVCVALIGFDSVSRPAAETGVKAIITDAANKWNALLVDDPLWTLKAKITPTFSFQETECPKNLPGFAVNVWGNVERFKAEYCSRPNYTCGGGGMAEYKSMYLGPWNRYQPQDPLQPLTIMHEYGHLLGLGDTYRIAGRNDWVGEQPPSVMNGQSETLTEDDKLGLRATLRFLKTGVRSCDGFGTDVEMTANDWSAVMCTSEATPIVTHGNPAPSASVPPPHAGTWAYTHFDSADTALRISSVSLTNSGYTFVASSVEQGASASSGTTYNCNAAGMCAAETDASYRILLASSSSLRLITPAYPAGYQASFLH